MRNLLFVVIDAGTTDARLEPHTFAAPQPIAVRRRRHYFREARSKLPPNARARQNRFTPGQGKRTIAAGERPLVLLQTCECTAQSRSGPRPRARQQQFRSRGPAISERSRSTPSNSVSVHVVHDDEFFKMGEGCGAHAGMRNRQNRILKRQCFRSPPRMCPCAFSSSRRSLARRQIAHIAGEYRIQNNARDPAPRSENTAWKLVSARIADSCAARYSASPN